jgi:glycosyltransferase involved in cell wall biosynthesis
MRIAYISVSDQLGGSEVLLLEIIKGVKRIRPTWPLHVILPGRGPLLELAEAAGADCVVLPLPAALARIGESAVDDSGWNAASRIRLGTRLLAVSLTLPAYIRRLRRLIAAARPDVVHTNGLKAHVAAARAVRGPRLVWHIHDYVSTRRVTRTLLRAHKDRATAIVANSQSVADDVAAALAGSVSVRVVRNGIDLDAFTPAGPVDDLDRRSGLPPAHGSIVRVGLIATFARWKGHDVFLRALAALPPDLPVRGYVIGAALYDTAGSQFSIEELQSLAKRLGLEGKVGFTGFLPAAPAMRALAVVVHASTRPEPFGLAIAEAMACGRAVVVSASGGAGEIIEPEHDALTHTPGDVEGLSRAIARLVADGELRRRLGARARENACQRFDAQRLAREIVEIYEQAAR